jgi:Trypsin-like peptidase domain
LALIKHLTGPLAGTETQIDKRAQRITFGRGSGNDVSYPPDFTSVGRDHFALVRKANDRWAVDLFGDFVAVDGVAADPGMVLPPGATVELGHRGGASFRFEPDRRADNLPDTETQDSDPGPRRLAEEARRRANRARMLALAGLVVAFVAAGGGYYVYSQFSPLEKSFREYDGRLATLANQSLSEDVRRKVERAAFLVGARNEQGQLLGLGTATPIAPRILITNAHVAEIRETLKKGLGLAVRAPGQDSRIYEVVDHKLHPGYRLFEQYGARDVIRVPLATGLSDPVRIGYGTYDVALLYVSEDIPKELQLELADENELRALGPGDPLGLAGHPQSGVANSDILVLGPAPKFQVGNVVGITDYFGLPAAFEQARFIHHNLPSSGGASGSAIVNAKGHIVALHNLGSKTGASTLNNGAQRSDLVRSLLEGRADAEIEKDKVYWDAQIARFKVGLAEVIEKTLEKDKPSPNAVAKEEHVWNAKLDDGDKVKITNDGKETIEVRQANRKLKLASGSYHTFILYTTNLNPTGLFLKLGEKIYAQQTGARVSVISLPGLVLPNDTDAELIVQAPNDETWYVLRHFAWQLPPGEKPTMRIIPPTN